MSVHKRAQKRTSSESKTHWLDAVQKSKVAVDPWKEFNIENEKTERALRFRYNALQGKWVQDKIQVKMQGTSFAKGAMRKCFRMKKLSTLVHQDDWHYATNLVAKIYIEEVLPKVYIDDVKLQMDAKLWAEEYNRHKPPKKVDIMQVACIKLIDREDTPMYHIEHFVEGDYVKYNSNSGFVLHQDKFVRDTPQAFSHFTFERSGHQMIVVDVQGVGDLYTDPQIHTAKGWEYGEANLGTKGMALFFASHRCLNICHDLDLNPFDLSDQETERTNAENSANSTSTSVKTHSHSDCHPVEPNIALVHKLQSQDSGVSMSPTDLPSDENGFEEVFFHVPQNDNSQTNIPRKRLDSELEHGNTENDACTHTLFFKDLKRKSSNVTEIPVLNEESMNHRLEARDHDPYEDEQISILGQIHYDLATYNYIGRFTEGIPDSTSALFHLQKSAACGILDAHKILAYKYFSFKGDEFEELEVGEDLDQGMTHLTEAASRGDMDSLLKAAKAYETGENLGSSRERSYVEALKWYETALNSTEGGTDTVPTHQIQANMAEIWRTGGFGVEKDPSYAGELYSSAAEAAMAIGKGKLSNKYFMLAEEVWGEMEE